MKVTKITVQYPTEEKTSLLSAALYPEMGFKPFTIKKVNQAETIKVRVEKNYTLDELCERITGLTPVEYQLKHGVAWNE